MAVFSAASAERRRIFPGGTKQRGLLSSFLRLWRNEWYPPARGTRLFSAVATVLLHILWLQLLLLSSLRFLSGVPDEEAGRGEEHVVQVEYIGEGTPEEDAGGAPPREAETPAADAPRPAPAVARTALPPVPQPLPEPAQAEPQPAEEPRVAPVAEQPLQVTETPEPDGDFVLPPAVRPVEVQVRVPDRLSAEVSNVRMREIAAPVPPAEIRELPRREVAVPETPRPQVDAVVREIPVVPQVELRQPNVEVAVPAPELRGDVRQPRLRSIPAPAAGQTRQASAGTPADDAAGSARTAAGASPAAPETGRTAGTRAAPATGSGTQPAPAAGALPSPRASDDWGLGSRNQPGGSQGMFDADGRPRLAGSGGGGGRVGGGLPPGTITEDYEKIDRMGTWLKRPPIDYEPTAFDRFWIPHETLLQEWVRRSIKEVLIPIPGTSKAIRCAVALLAVGGACGIFDPNMQDVEAEARPPPDIPFKPELQEDQESLARPPPDPH